ncbi:Cytochrome c [Parafilimonas terrae]|uniref:Cytochrome c n=2 Tax=Parafilimonas terrae TaxID=1465490 RepID=A0A1I5TRH3_9BACT|nr:Cytochrome c [Parafilimonas terrae]
MPLLIVFMISVITKSPLDFKLCILLKQTDTTMKKMLAITIISALLYACSGGAGNNDNSNADSNSTDQNAGTKSLADYDPHRGEGKFSNVEVGPLDATMADAGKKIFDVKCSACHKLTDEKLVGPGWAGVTERHQPAWIMNFITNPDAMIDKDPALQSQLEICLVRMPNQNLTDDDARHILEFMRKNDGAK